MYDRKPVWWESVKIESYAAPTNLPAVEQALVRSRASRRAIEDWRVIGPFDAPKGQGWDTVYPPEQKIDSRAVYKGTGGVHIAWQKWDAGKPCPIPPKLANAAVFFFKSVTASVSGKTLLLVASDDRAAVWINGRQVFRDEQRHALTEDDPRIIPVELESGPNSLLIKVEQTDGAWGMKAWWASANPWHLIIRSLTESFQTADEKQRRDVADRLFDAYARLDGESGNALFWAAYGIVHRPEEEARRRLQDAYRRMEPTAKDNPDLAGFLQKIFAESENPAVQRLAVEYYFGVMLLRQEYDALCAFVDQNPSALAKVLPGRFLYHKLDALYQKGDPIGAAACLEQMRLESPSIERDGTFQTWVNRVDAMRLIKAKPSVDLERDTTIDAARKLGDEENAAKLNQFLRETLESKRGSVVAVADDAMLYRGALAVYKEALAGYGPTYQPALRRYVDALSSIGTLSTAALNAAANRLSLAPLRAAATNAPSPWASLGDVQLPPAAAAERRLLTGLHPGCFEQAGRIDSFTRTVAAHTLPGCRRVGNKVLIQSSRDVVCVENGRVAWHTTFSNSRIAISGALCPFLGSPVPAADARRVYARVAEKEQFGLVALDLATGRREWSLPPIYSAASDPEVAGESVLCVVRESGAIAKYTLLILGRETGRLEDSIFLFSGPDTLRFWQEFAAQLQIDLAMPAPVVDGGRAYLVTNAGLLFCVDLADRSIRWAREYLRPPFHADRKASLRLGSRRVCGPVVGERNVFVAPADGSEVLLLDKLSGRRVAGDSRFDWRECRPFGRSKMLMLTTDAGQALVFSLDSLDPSKTLAGKDWQYIEPLADGALVAHDRQLVALSESGTGAAAALPEGLRPLALSGGRCIGLASDGIYPMLAVAAAPGEAATSPDLRCERRSAILSHPSLLRRGGRLFVVADNSVVAYDSALAPQWAYPLAYERPEIEVTADHVFLAFPGRLVGIPQNGNCPDLDDPPPGQPPCAFGGRAVVAGKLLIARSAGQAGWVIQAVAEGELSVRGAVPEVDFVRGVFANGDTLLAHRDSVLVLPKFDRKTGGYALKENAVQPLNVPPGAFASWAVGDSGMLYAREDALCLYANGKFAPFTFAEGSSANRDWATPAGHRAVGDWLAVRRFFDRCAIVDGSRLTDLGADVPFAQFPVACGGMLCGMISSTNVAALAFAWYDPAQRKVVQTATVPKTDLPGFAAHDYRHEMSAALDDAAYHFFAPTRGVERGIERLLVIQDAKPPQLRASSFPGSTALCDIAGSGKRVLLATGDNAIAMDRTQMDRLQTAVAPVVTVSHDPAFKVDVDGFLDEWPAPAFHAAGTNAFAALSTGKDLVLAGLLRGTNLMQRIGSRGLDGRVTLRLMPGAVAAFARDAASAWGFETTPADAAAQGCVFACAMRPTGDECTFEARIPLEKILRFPAAEMPNEPFRAKRGDIAFDVSFRNDDGNVWSLFPQRVASWPVYDTRLLFESPKK